MKNKSVCLFLIFLGHLSYAQIEHIDGLTKLINPNGRTLLIERNDDDSWLTFHDPKNSWFSMGIDKSYNTFSLNAGGGLNSAQFVLDLNGNIGIGTALPTKKVHIVGSSFNDLFSIDSGLDDGGRIFTSYVSGGATLNFVEKDDPFVLRFAQTEFNSESMIAYNRGNFGIGTLRGDAKLTVKGNVHAEEVRVDLNVPAPDYVFDNKYVLRSLEDVNRFIKKNKHLPEIPSARELQLNGITLGEMNMGLLKKIEELTLYIIQQEQRITQLEDSK